MQLFLIRSVLLMFMQMKNLLPGSLDVAYEYIVWSMHYLAQGLYPEEPCDGLEFTQLDWDKAGTQLAGGHFGVVTEVWGAGRELDILLQWRRRGEDRRRIRRGGCRITVKGGGGSEEERGGPA